MKQSAYKALQRLLFRAPYISTDGKDTLLKAKISSDARKHDPMLLGLLLSDPTVKSAFFVDVAGASVFKTDEFIRLLNGHEFLPSSFTAFGNRIGLSFGGKYLKTVDDVVIDFPYKDCVLAGGQTKEEETRQEVFYHETLAADEITCLLDRKVFTNIRRYSKTGAKECAEFKANDNLLIKGNNLIVLHSLKERFRGKVKLIYIDPPFNTESDAFRYNDRFTHSSWLAFMKNRLEVALELLAPDGFIFVQLDDKEAAYCKVLMDEVFGRDNYRNTITLTTNDPSGFKATGKSIFSTANYIFVYAKEGSRPKMEKLFIETDYDTNYKKVLQNPEASPGKWEWENIGEIVARENGFETSREAKRRMEECFDASVKEYAIANAERVFRTAAISGGARAKRLDTIKRSMEKRDVVITHPGDDVPNFYILNGEQIIFYKDRLIEIDGEQVPGQMLTDVWTDIGLTGLAGEGGVELKYGKKPEKLVRRILEMVTTEGDLVLDFFAGSGTTLAVAHKMKRQYIGIEQMDYIEELTLQRLKNVMNGDTTGISRAIGWDGGGDVVYMELAKWNAQVADLIDGAKTTKEIRPLLKKLSELPYSAFVQYAASVPLTEEAQEEFFLLPLAEQKLLLIALLDKNQLYVNYTEIEDADHEFGAAIKKFNASYYGGPLL